MIRPLPAPIIGELGLQDLLVFQNPGQQGGRYFAGVGWRRGDDFHYGWIEFLGVSGIQMNVVAWAWESEPNTPILAGAIPKPSAVWLAGAFSSCVACGTRKGAEGEAPL